MALSTEHLDAIGRADTFLELMVALGATLRHACAPEERQVIKQAFNRRCAVLR